MELSECVVVGDWTSELLKLELRLFIAIEAGKVSIDELNELEGNDAVSDKVGEGSIVEIEVCESNSEYVECDKFRPDPILDVEVSGAEGDKVGLGSIFWDIILTTKTSDAKDGKIRSDDDIIERRNLFVVAEDGLKITSRTFANFLTVVLDACISLLILWIVSCMINFRLSFSTSLLSSNNNLTILSEWYIFPIPETMIFISWFPLKL